MHLRGLGTLHTTTPPCSLHLLRGLKRPSGEKFRGLLGIPSGETPASTEGKIDPNNRNNTSNFFMSLNLDARMNEVIYHSSLNLAFTFDTTRVYHTQRIYQSAYQQIDLSTNDLDPLYLFYERHLYVLGG